MELQDQRCIVTGAASGIGRAIAARFLQLGARVAIADLDESAAHKTADELGPDGRAIGVRMDVSDEEQVSAGVAKVVSQWGGVDVLVSNAGIQIISPLEELAFAQWKKLLAVHLDGAFLTTRACLPHMYANGHGKVIYTGSVHSKVASHLKAPYVTAKHGLLGLAKVVALEGAPHHVAANVICPGFVRTPLVDRQIPEQAKDLGISEKEVVRDVMLRETVDGEFTSTDDIAEVAAFLAAFPSLALTGQSVVASHGWFMA
ncbi:3-hydroxybutyrate dehydrogenase [Cognatazoarcus halotolerans]|uniref:3-hydroxybutyrate dehydrogenase n=1 Tax=Cognatazoarcus halotolerans TaxID=2686016 RepID=UPI00135CCBE0|nr:3-hydroxybutyrate dehydrogenase [Cognatazoarcus halotolerans]MCP5308203.1 3-hydroxybutyrate dehydrogenase [Zoogloeaceae bacterium]